MLNYNRDEIEIYLFSNQIDFKSISKEITDLAFKTIDISKLSDLNAFNKIREFKKLNTEVIGISKDSIEAHLKFIDKQELKIILASDEDGKVIEKFGVWVEKNMYGRKYMGIQRSTFLINEQSKIEYIWDKVRVKGHVEDVIDKIKTS